MPAPRDPVVPATPRGRGDGCDLSSHTIAAHPRIFRG